MGLAEGLDPPRASVDGNSVRSYAQVPDIEDTGEGLAMATTEISPEKMAQYIEGARSREALRRSQQEERRAMARRLAEAAALVLRREFGATRVVLFGSVVTGRFNEGSDIDLAVEGLAAERYFAAWAAAEKATEGFPIDLVAMESTGPWVADALRRDGIEL